MRLHFIAIGGSAMHNLAIALKKEGHNVTGSDDALFEPSRSRLDRYGILPSALGWDPANITADLDAVILGMHARKDNPELLKARDLQLKIYSYPEYLYEQSKDKKRVVIGGSHGKTTITSMILHVLNGLSRDIDYMVGAQLEGFDTMVKISDSDTIVIEGDEYLTSPIDPRPKFHVYQANVAIISGIAWDHVNVFPTFENYVDQFRTFIKTIMPGGVLIYNENDQVVNTLVNETEADVTKIAYSLPANHIENSVTILDTAYGPFSIQVFGKHNLSNMEAARIACNQLGVSDEQFYNQINTFKGASKRLELLANTPDSLAFKDFAHSPSKLKATIEAVKEQFPQRELVAVIELHTFSSLNASFLNEYHDSMNVADVPVVFIDERTFAHKQLKPYGEAEVKEAFGNNQLNFFSNNESLVKFLSTINYKGKNLLLMSSGNFGGIALDELAVRLLGT